MTKMSLVEKSIVNSKLDYWFHQFFGTAKILRWIDQPEDIKHVLEIGCGVGLTTALISKQLPQAYIAATDSDNGQVEQAKKAVSNSHITFALQDATRLTFPDESFDVCFAILVFHHIPNFSEAIDQVHRVLRKNGKLFVMEVPFKTVNPLYKWSLFGQGGLFTRTELITILRKAGFKINKVKGNLLFSLECVKT